MVAGAAQMLGVELAHLLDGIFDTVYRQDLGFVQHNADAGHDNHHAERGGDVGAPYEQQIHEPHNRQDAEYKNSRLGLQKEDACQQHCHRNVKSYFGI